MSEFATVQDINKLKAEVKKLLTPLNKLTCDENVVEKYMKEECKKREQEILKKDREKYKFRLSTYESLLCDLVNTERVQEILETETDYIHYYDMDVFLKENHQVKMEEIMKILIEAHDKIGLILLPLVAVDEKKKKMGSFSTRRAKYNLENVV